MFRNLIDLFFVFTIAVIGASAALNFPNLVRSKCPAGTWCSALQMIFPTTDDKPVATRDTCTSKADAAKIFRLSARISGLDEEHAPIEELFKKLSFDRVGDCRSVAEVAAKTCELLRPRSFATLDACAEVGRNDPGK